MAGRLLGHVRTLLEAIPGHAAAPVRELPMLTAAERRQILVDWNDTVGDYPRDRRLEQLVEEQVDRTPDAVAVVHEGRSWTFRELDERANRLARHLRGLGIGPRSLVGVCMNRSAEMVAAVLGILKAGAAYVPFDPAYPKERLAFLLRDTEAAALVTQVRRLGQLPETNVPVVCIDADWPTMALHPTTRLSEPEALATDGVTVANASGSDEIAYVIYTSGTTGTPKGVVVRHRAVVNTIDWVNRTFAVGPGDRVLWVTSLCFDLSVYDLFGVLSAGGTVRVATGSELRGPERLQDILANEPITIWDSAPPLLGQLVPHFDKVADRETKLRLVMLSGDWIPVALPDQVRTTFPAAKVVSLGGATEAAIWSNWYPVEKVDPAWASIPYGRPIRNARYYLLDVHGQPAPVGVPAELYIAGDCVADGYWHRPALTAERFLPDPFFPVGWVEGSLAARRPTDLRAGGPSSPPAPRPTLQERMYRTGDLAKFWPDGTIEFLGRRDHQVKVRGFRIELGEVEATLARHPAVEQAVAAVMPDAIGEKQLVAYAVPRPGQELSAAELRRFLRERLPEYMVPAHVVLLDRLPLSANGKVDRKSMPSPLLVGRASSPSLSKDGLEARPTNPTELALANVWREVLGLPEIGIHDNFFELGGHSINAAQVVSRVRQRLGKELPLTAFFRAPTIAAMAEAIRAGSVSDGSGRAVAHTSGSDRAPAGPTQRQIWFLHQLGQGSEVYNIAYGLRLTGRLDAATLQAALTEIVARHAALRTTFDDDGGPLWQVVHPPYPVELPKVNLFSPRSLTGGDPESTARVIAAAFAREPFDFRRGPLFRARLLRLGDDDHRLLLAWHHLIFDGQSLAIFLRDLATHYTAAVGGRTAELPPAPSFADDCRRFEADLAGRLPDLVAHWTRKLSPPPPPVELPGTKPRPADPTYRGQITPLGLTPETAEAVAALARKEGATPFTVLLAAFEAVVHRLTGAEDFAVGAPVACRTRPETDEVVGPLVNTVVLRADLSDEPTFADLLARTRRTVHDALAHQELPFDQLVSELRPSRTAGPSPLFQLLFNYSPGPPLPADPRHALVGRAGADRHVQVRPVAGPGRRARRGAARIGGYIESSTDLFDAATVERFAGHFRTLLAAAVADPGVRVGRMPLLTEAERGQTDEWNATAVEQSSEPAHRLIANRAAVAPDGVAIRDGSRSLTYSELDRAANRLAHHLGSLGVEPDMPVGIALERSADWVIAALARLEGRWCVLAARPAASGRSVGAGPAGCSRTGRDCIIGSEIAPGESPGAKCRPRGRRRHRAASRTPIPASRSRRTTSPTSFTPPARPARPRA